MKQSAKHLTFLVVTALILVAGLAACRPAATPAPTPRPDTPTPEPVVLPTQTATASPVPPTMTAVPSETPPPSETPAPTATPAASATPLTSMSEQTAAMRPAFAADLETLGPLSEYWIAIEIDPEIPLVSGQQQVHYVNHSNSELESIYFRLFPNLPSYGGEMKVSEVQVGGVAADPELRVEGTALRIPLSEPLLPGDSIDLALLFSVQVPLTPGEGYGQFLYDQGVMALANFYPLIPSYDVANCEQFGHCDGGWNIEYTVPQGDAVYSETALYTVEATVPAGWTVVSTGSTASQEPGPAGTKVWHLVSGPVRDFNLALSPQFERATTQVGDLVINSYYLPADQSGGQWALAWAADAIDYFEQTFGPYPFAEFDVVETANIAGGIEYPGLIAMPIHNYAQVGGFFQWATVHEVAHQWWYSLVGNDQQDEPWLDEALTQYSTALYYEFRADWPEAVDEMFVSTFQTIQDTTLDDLIDRPVAAYSEANYGPVVYYKGPLFFHALRQELGDEAFFALLQDYFAAFRYRVTSQAELREAINQAAGRDMSPLYQQWLGE